MKVKDVAVVNQLNVTASYPHSEIEYIDTASVTEGRFDASQKMSLKHAPSRAKRIVRHNDIVISTVRPNLQHYGIFKKPSNNTVVSTGFTVITCEGIYPDYLYRLLTTSWYTEFLAGIAESQQSNYPAFNPSLIENTVIDPPSIATQKKIAAILSAYDELIENNQRRIALLEKMAEEIYREWFVRMRFPGHEKVKLVKGLPPSWRVAELKELASVNPSNISRRGSLDSILYVDISSVSTSRIDNVTLCASADAPGRARRRVKHGDVIWSSVRPANRAYCLIYEPPENLIVSTGFAVIRPNAATPFTLLFFAVTSNPFVDQMTTVAKGAAYPATSFDDFEKAKLLVPTDDLLTHFHEKAEPLFRQKHLLQQQSERLRQTRDLLLPRLISGKLSVENLDIQFPPSMLEEMKAEPTAHV